MKEQILKIAKDLEKGTITETEAQNLLLGLFGVNEVEFCTCGNPSGEGNIQMDDEEMLYFCCDCGKQNGNC